MHAGAGALLRHPSFLLFLLSRSLSRFSSQIGGGRDRLADLRADRQRLRSRHGRAGAVPARPRCLVFVAGNAADRYERKRVMQLCQLARSADGVVSGLGRVLPARSRCCISSWRSVVLGTAGAFESPTIAALLPLIVPQGSLQRATAMSSGAAQIAQPSRDRRSAALPMRVAPSMPYGIMVLFWLSGAILTGAHPPDAAGRRQGSGDAGRSVRRRQVRPQQSGDPRHDLARSVRRAARRRHRAAADLCARHPARPARSASASCAPRPRSAPC